MRDLGLDPGVDLDRYAQAIYLDHLPPQEQARHRAAARQMAQSQSGCGLAWERWARCVGVAWPHLYRWYGDRIGTAISANVAEAKKGAWVDADRLPVRLFPQPGDMVLIGGRGLDARGGLAAEHVLLVRQVDGSVLHSLDGGQPGIGERTRVMVISPQGELWLANTPPGGGGEVQLGPDGRPLVGRRVRGWIDHTRLPYQPGGGPPTTPYPPGGGTSGGGTSGGGGASHSYGGGEGCPPCPPGLDSLDWLLALLLGILGGQAVEGHRRRRRRPLL